MGTGRGDTHSEKRCIWKNEQLSAHRAQPSPGWAPLPLPRGPLWVLTPEARTQVPSPSRPPPSYLPQSTSLCRLKEERYYEEMETLLGPGPLRLEELEDLLYSPLEWEWG